MDWGLLILLVGLVLLTVLVMRGTSILVAAPLTAASILSLTWVAVWLANPKGLESLPTPLQGMSHGYLQGFADYIERFYLIFVLGAAFGRLMDDSGGASSIARAVGRWFGPRRACLSVVLASAVLTYGGVSLFVVGFSVYPLAVGLFRGANLPRRFIPAAIAFGSVTFTMTSAGSPEIQNLIPIRYLVDDTGPEPRPLTDALAGWPVSLIVAGLMFAAGQLYLEWSIARDVARGAGFEPRAGDPEPEFAAGGRPGRGPAWQLALAPLVVTLAALNLLPRVWSGFPEDPVLAIFLGVVSGVVLLAGWLGAIWKSLGHGFVNGLLAIGATASIVGFGTAVKDLPAFARIVDWATHPRGDPLIGAALAVAVIAAIAGSASGGQGLALPIIKPIFIDQLGVAPRALHRVVAIASGSLDSLPANGYIVTLIHNVCGETHARAYGPIFVTTVLVPLVGTGLAILLFKLVPAWGLM